MKGQKWVYPILMLSVFAVGIIVGSIYAVNMRESAAAALDEYISDFLKNSDLQKNSIFLSSLVDNLKVFAIIFIAGFFKIGTPAVLACGVTEGFVSGFTTAAMIKLKAVNGLWISLASLPAALIFVADLVFFGAYSMDFGITLGKKDVFLKKSYFIFSLIALTIFCVAALCDGYITTIFMKMLVTKM